MQTRILLIEDEPGIQLAMRGLLRRDGHEVCIESSGKGAMDAIEAESFDLIVTDLSLPDGVSGLDVARRARELCSATPVVLITAYGTEQIKNEAKDAGVWDYVPKPFDNRVVRDVVRRASEARQR